jgi:hypothetical protein
MEAPVNFYWNKSPYYSEFQRNPGILGEEMSLVYRGHLM